MSKPLSPPSSGGEAPATPPPSNGPLPLGSSSNSPPRPQVPPGHASPVRTPHPHDVLSGRGGRINGHPGNVRFREMVDSYKREYLDPRTKKVEKARIAARIVQNVRTLDPPGRFLKEDPHTGLWVEIGDERAWKKAGQALRESAPEIRAERQAQLQMLAAGAGADARADAIGAGGGAGKGRKSRAADPPGPRHRPNPPEREGLARSTGSARSGFNEDAELASRGNNSQLPPQNVDDPELARMRAEYVQMQRMQAEQERRMQQYQARLQAQQAAGNGASMGGNMSAAGSVGGSSYGRDVYEEYNQMQQGLMGGYRQRVHQEAREQMAREAARQLRGSQGSNVDPRYANHQDIAQSIMDEGLLPVNAGFDIPALRGEGQGGRGYQQGQQGQFQQNQYGQQGYRGDFDQGNAIQAQQAFDRSFNNCDKTVSTMSSFDIQSMDMSSLGGFSWNQSAYNMSGLISTGSHMSSNRHNSFNASGMSGGGNRGKSKSKGGKSALERKLEKVNEQHRRQQVQEMQRKMAMQGGNMPQDQGQGGPQMHPHGGISVPTAGGAAHQAQMQAQAQNQGRSPSNKSRKFSQESANNMASMNSFGFEAIEEDEFTEASYKMSNLGLSEMDMTFGSDVLSVRSKSVPKMRGNDEGKDKKGEEELKRKDSKDRAKYSRSDGDADELAGRVVNTSSRGAGLEKIKSEGDADELNARSGDKPKGGIMASSVFNQSLSSGSHTSSSLSKNSSVKKPFNMSMEDFNESFKSMEVEDRSRSTMGNSSGGGSGGGGGIRHHARGKQLPDPDGAMAGGVRGGNMGPPRSKGSRKDPNGGRLGTIHSSRASQQQRGASAGASASSGNVGNRLGAARRESYESMGLSDPDMLGGQFASQSNADFGVSLESLRSFQSVQSGNSDASSWLNQYNSMENVAGDRDPWGDEDRANASDGTSMSEISAPRMVTATGGDGS